MSKNPRSADSVTISDHDQICLVIIDIFRYSKEYYNDCSLLQLFVWPATIATATSTNHNHQFFNHQGHWRGILDDLSPFVHVLHRPLGIAKRQVWITETLSFNHPTHACQIYYMWFLFLPGHYRLLYIYIYIYIIDQISSETWDLMSCIQYITCSPINRGTNQSWWPNE